MNKFAFVLICACLVYTDTGVFWWLGQYFFSRSFARTEHLFPALMFSVLGTGLSIVFFANFPTGLNRWVKYALTILGLPPIITLFALMLGVNVEFGKNSTLRYLFNLFTTCKAQ